MKLKEALIAMSAILGIDKTKIPDTVDAETDLDIEIPSDLKVFTKDGLKKYKDEQAGASIEIAVKEYKAKNGLTFAGKGIDDLVSHIESKNDSEERVKKLQLSLKEAQDKADAAINRADQIEMETEIHGAIPAEYNGLSRKELRAIAVANGFDFKRENGKLATYRNGERVREERTQADIDAATALKGFFETEKGFKVAETTVVERVGRGGENTPARGTVPAPKRSVIEKEWQTSNPDKNINGMEYQSHFAKTLQDFKAAGQTVEMD